MFDEEYVEWENATQKCQELGARLPVLSDPETIKIVKKYLDEADFEVFEVIALQFEQFYNPISVERQYENFLKVHMKETILFANIFMLKLNIIQSNCKNCNSLLFQQWDRSSRRVWLGLQYEQGSGLVWADGQRIVYYPASSRLFVWESRLIIIYNFIRLKGL